MDAVISRVLAFSGEIPDGQARFLAGHNVEARDVLYIGVGSLGQFRYSQIREFGKKALGLAAEGPRPTRLICTPIHGPGYGLDEREAFLSLIAGFLDGIETGKYPPELEKIEIVELNARRAGRLQEILSRFTASEPLRPRPTRDGDILQLSTIPRERLTSFGAQSEQKIKLFVAMPFAPEHSDIWEIAIQEACKTSGLICERMDEKAYTGDILAQIKSGLDGSNGVVAVLDDANPNVFLEIGFAWGLGKPTVLVAKKDIQLPFDVRGQKCIHYTSIANLRSVLTAELTALKSAGIFGEMAIER